MKADRGFAEGLISNALRQGASQAEVFVRSVRSLSIEVKDLSVDSLKSSLSSGYSLRLIRDGRLGFSFSTTIGEADNVVRRALEAATYSDEDVDLVLPETGRPADVAVFDPEVRDITEEEAVGRALMIEQAARDYDGRVRKVRKASCSFASSVTLIVNSRSGSAQEYASTACSGQITAIAQREGDSQMGWDYEGARFLRDLSFERIGTTAAQRAVSLLGSRKIAGCRGAVLLDNSVVADFLGVFGSSLSAEAVQKGKSLLAGRLGEKVISDKVHLIDSGLLPGRLGTSPVDGEGVAVREKTVIEGGVLRTFLHNTYSARKAGTRSTGNAARGGFSSLPTVGITNLFLRPVSENHVLRRTELFRALQRGLYVVEAMGIHTANQVSGDFSVGVAGIWVENGEPQYPVKEAVISGNVLAFFDNIDAVGDDMRFYGNIGGPSLIVSDVDISA